jgi:hypothetical protein
MNINIFLNENCKNAINMSHFLSSIRIELKDLIHTEQHGIIEGISNIIMNNINKLSFDERPVHCSDLKREVLYIKNDDIWEKDDENKSKTKDAIQHIANLQVKNVKLWKKENPNYMESDKKKDEFIALVKNVTTDIKGKENKIIKAICKDTHISKDNIE